MSSIKGTPVCSDISLAEIFDFSCLPKITTSLPTLAFVTFVISTTVCSVPLDPNTGAEIPEIRTRPPEGKRGYPFLNPNGTTAIRTTLSKV